MVCKASAFCSLPLPISCFRSCVGHHHRCSFSATASEKSRTQWMRNGRCEGQTALCECVDAAECISHECVRQHEIDEMWLDGRTRCINNLTRRTLPGMRRLASSQPNHRQSVAEIDPYGEVCVFFFLTFRSFLKGE